MRARTLLFLMAACLALASAPAPSQAAKVDVYAIVGARVVTVAGPVHEGGTVILRDGVIEAVGAKLAIPVDARVIDGKGLTLTPGLIDGFGGLGLPTPARSSASPGAGGAPAPAPAPAAQSAAPSNPLSPQTMILEKVRAAEALRARDSGITTALVVSREGVLPGKSALINLSGTKVEGMALRQPAALHLHLSTATRQYPSALMGTLAHARQSLHAAIHYRDEWAAYEKAPAGKKRPRYDPALAAWQDVLGGRQPLVVTANRENDIRRALALADEFKLRIAVAGAPRAFRLIGLLKARRVPLLVSVNFDPPRPVTFGVGGDEEKEKKEIEEAQRNPAELHKAGVPFALVSAFAPSFLSGVRKAIEVGLPREAALRALTLDAARALGVADRTGSLEKGKIANLVAWAGDPLAKAARVKMVFVDGQLYEPPERPERKDEKDDEDRPDRGPDGEPTADEDEHEDEDEP